MTLTPGDFFAGTYQLRESLPGSDRTDSEAARWRADDYSANRQQEVVLDIVPRDHDEALHWLIEMPGLNQVGQVASPAARYFAWEPAKIQSIAPFDYHTASTSERKIMAALIEQLPVAAHETIHADDMPEFWRAGENGWVVFYRKHQGGTISHKEKQAVRNVWTDKLYSPAPGTSPESESNEADHLPVPAPSPSWPLFMVGGGILLLGALYLTVPAPPPPSEVAFNRAIERGKSHVEKGEFESAILAFKEAASAPPSDELDLRLDSLARSYETLARRECGRFRETASANLYFIPNHYFQYTAILSRWPEPEVCD